MPFQYILGNLLASNDDALAALFLDAEGETIDLACSQLEPGEVRVVGAYLGITLRRMRAFLDTSGLGRPRLLHFEIQRLHLYVQTLPEGYFVALVQRRPAPVARARGSLSAAARELAAEVFPEGQAASEL